MTLSDFYNSYTVDNVNSLESSLARRFEGECNSFWLFHRKPGPALSILVKGDLAYAHYFPNEQDAGFRSIGHIISTPGTTIFCLDAPNQEQPILNDAVIPFFEAVTVAKEFFLSEEMPQSIKWMEL